MKFFKSDSLRAKSDVAIGIVTSAIDKLMKVSADIENQVNQNEELVTNITNENNKLNNLKLENESIINNFKSLLGR